MESLLLLQNKNMKIVLIHGANASTRSFNYIIDRLNIQDSIVPSYSSADSFYRNLDSMKELISGTNEPLFFIGHSLGGIYALHLYDHFRSNVVGAVTLATPYRGSRTADWAKMIVPQYHLFHDVGVHSKPIVESLRVRIDVPWLQVVSTTGHVPWHVLDNDGVVTVASMTHRKDIEYVELPVNHYEIVCEPETVEIIRSRITL
jgi:pimeloyl-ACP methyl ester carboxylesterase